MARLAVWRMADWQVATGFVVDAERGLILTNRHVVHQGPVTAEAIFLNDEEVRTAALRCAVFCAASIGMLNLVCAQH